MNKHGLKNSLPHRIAGAFRLSNLSAPATYIPFIVAAITFPMMAIPSYTVDAAFEPEPANTLLAMAAYGTMFTASLAGIMRGRPLTNLFHQQDWILLLFFATIILSAILQGLSNSIVYSLFLFLSFISLRTASYSKIFVSSIILSTLICIAYMVAAQIILGPPVKRWLGGIHPNIYGASIITAIALSTFASFKFFNISFLICLTCAVIVSSRYAMISSVIIYISFCIMNYRRCGWFQIFILIVIFFIVLFDFLFSGAEGYVGSALQLGSSDRGLSSGLTGRDSHWSYFIPQISDRPFLGYGFRNRESFYGAHNGFMNLILECGILGSTLILSYLLIRILSLIKEFINTENNEVRGRLLSVSIGVIFAVNLQPQFINFGDPMGLLVMILLFSRPGLERLSLKDT